MIGYNKSFIIIKPLNVILLWQAFNPNKNNDCCKVGFVYKSTCFVDETFHTWTLSKQLRISFLITLCDWQNYFDNIKLFKYLTLITLYAHNKLTDNNNCFKNKWLKAYMFCCIGVVHEGHYCLRGKWYKSIYGDSIEAFAL